MSYQQFFKVISLPQPPSFQQYNYICIKYCPVVLDHLRIAIGAKKHKVLPVNNINFLKSLCFRATSARSQRIALWQNIPFCRKHNPQILKSSNLRIHNPQPQKILLQTPQYIQIQGQNRARLEFRQLLLQNHLISKQNALDISFS